MFYILAGIAGIIIGALVGLVYCRFSASGRIQLAQQHAEQLTSDAKKHAETLKKEALIEAKEEILKQKQAAEADEKQRNQEIRERENRLSQREDSLDRRSDTLDKREHQLSSQAGQLDRKHKDLDVLIGRTTSDLERIAQLTTDEAKQELLDKVSSEVSAKAASIIRDSEARIKAEADKQAREILTVAIQRLASDQVAEVTVTSVSIPSDDLKGRIIGREGRNIRTFEQMTGVNLIIDDTPETVVLSSFDPVRREIARITLENLIADGRIHPARIEEMFNKASELVNQRVLDAGEQAAYDVGITDLHPEIVKTLGRLKYRTSYGQNVLHHSVEVAKICSMIAAELGLDTTIAKRAGLLHDIGKALDHDIEGSHAIIGADVARRCKESPIIVNAIESHHNEVEQQSMYAYLVMAGDAVSAARPGSRRESAENYIKRLEKLETISNSYKGVERTYAMQAGREIRVMVRPEEISDSDSVVLAHNIAHQIEDEMQYPGQVKVVVIRESRSVDYAK